MGFGHATAYLPSLLALGKAPTDSFPLFPLQEGTVTSLCQNLLSIPIHLWEDLTGMADVANSWISSATEEGMNWTHTTMSASMVPVRARAVHFH